MGWKDDCLKALDTSSLFENSAHRTRFKELVDCYSSYPFFTKGLCKCMYLSAWDEEHFCIMLQMLMNMSVGRESNTDEMRSMGDILAEEHMDAEYYVYQLSNTFLDDQPYLLDISKLPPEIIHIIEQAKKAAEIIDTV